MISKRTLQIREQQKQFEEKVMYSKEFQDLIYSVIIDAKDKQQRAVIIASSEADKSKIEKLAGEYFEGQLYKVVQYKEAPKFSVSVQLVSGNGVRHPTTQGWGTLGGFFKLKGSTRSFGLSNNHVISNLAAGQKGDPVMYKPDGVEAGNLFRKIQLKPPPFENKIDAALFVVSKEHRTRWKKPKPVKVSPTIPWIGPKRGLKVYKNGDATNKTEGVVTGTNGGGTVKFNGKPYRFKGIFAVRTPNGQFNMPGDSGSVIISQRGNHMVGIVFAKLGDFCWALPISRIKPLLKEV